jgi:hypothetical protein
LWLNPLCPKFWSIPGLSKDPVKSVGNASTLVGAACLIGGAASEGAGWIACGYIVGTGALLIDTTKAFVKPSASATSSGVAASDAVGFVCGAADAITHSAAKTACGAIASSLKA